MKTNILSSTYHFALALLRSSLRNYKALAVMMGVPGTAFGDIALVPAPFLKHPKGIRDVAEWYMSTTMRRLRRL